VHVLQAGIELFSSSSEILSLYVAHPLSSTPHSNTVADSIALLSSSSEILYSITRTHTLGHHIATQQLTEQLQHQQLQHHNTKPATLAPVNHTTRQPLKE